MAVTLSQKQLSKIATLAYGSRCYEGTSGGRGNIGLIGGHVVKFNTHKGSGGLEKDAMSESCNRLRLKLDKLAVSLLRESRVSVKEFENEIASIRAKLGLSADGQNVVATGLLDRKVVASVVRQIDARTGANSFHRAQVAQPSSRHVDTRFGVVAADSLARKFMEDHRGEVDELLGRLLDGRPGVVGLSAGNRKMLENVLQRSLEAIYAENGTAKMDDLQAEGSAYNSIKKLATANLFNMRMVNLALSLPAKEVAPFLKACRIFPDAGYRTIDRFFAVAPRLAQLKPSKFTLENILNLARPGELDPKAIREAQNPLDGPAVTALLQPISALVDGNLTVFKFMNLLALGASTREADAYLKNPKGFSVKSLPKTAFLPCTTELNENFESARKTVSGDFPRLHGIQVEIREPGGRLRYKMPEEMRDGNAQVKVDENGKSPLAHFMDQIERLCGKDNVAQQQLVLLFMSQNALMPEALFEASQGVTKGNDLQNMKCLLKADPATGDVFVSRTTDPAKEFGMSVTLRIGRDGTMSVVDLQERKTAGVLIPKDGNGNPMAVEGPVGGLAEANRGAPVQPPRPETVHREFDEMLLRATENALVRSHADTVSELATSVLKGKDPNLSTTDDAYLKQLVADVRWADSAFGDIAKLTVDELAKALAEPPQDAAQEIREKVETACRGYRELSASCRWLFQKSGNESLELAELANGYAARASELEELVGKLRADGANPPADGATSVLTRLAGQAVGQRGTRGTLKGLADKLSSLDRALAETRGPLVKDGTVAETRFRLNRLGIDLHLALEDLRLSLAGSRQILRSGGQADTTVVQALFGQLESVQRKIADRIEALDGKPTTAYIKARAQEFLAANGDVVSEIVSGLAERLPQPRAKRFDQVPEENRVVVESLIRRSVEAVIAENGDVRSDLLVGPGSTYKAFVKLADKKILTVRVVSCAQSLPPREANAFLRAYAMFPSCDHYGVAERLHAVASELARLPPGKFTLEHVLNLAAPELKIPRSVRRRNSLTENELEEVFRPFDALAKEEGANPMTSSMIASGMSLTDIKTCYKDLRMYSPTMLPPAEQLVGNFGRYDVNDALECFFKDVHRNKVHLTIREPNGQSAYELPKILRGNENADPDRVRDFLGQIEALCGKENKAQQAHVIFAMSQNGGIGDMLASESAGNGPEGYRNQSITLQKDEKTGDVVMTRRAGSNMKSGLVTVMRFSPDGTQKVVSSQMEEGQRFTLEVDEIDGKLTADQLTKLRADPTKTSGPVTVQYPEDIEEMKTKFAEKYKVVLADPAPKKDGKPQLVKMKNFLGRGDFVFKIGLDKTFDRNDVRVPVFAEWQKRCGVMADEMAREIGALMEGDAVLADLLDYVVGEYLSAPFVHKMLKDNYNITFVANDFSPSHKVFALTKNLDGSYRIAISAKVNDVKTLYFQNSETDLKVMKISQKGKSSNSCTYEMAFDLAMGEDGPVVRPAEDRMPTLTFDLRGNELVSA